MTECGGHNWLFSTALPVAAGALHRSASHGFIGPRFSFEVAPDEPQAATYTAVDLHPARGAWGAGEEPLNNRPRDGGRHAGNREDRPKPFGEGSAPAAIARHAAAACRVSESGPPAALGRPASL